MKRNRSLYCGMFLTLLLIGSISSFFWMRGRNACGFVRVGEQVVQAAQVATGDGISQDTEKTYQVKIYIENVLVETKNCYYGEKLILKDYYDDYLEVDKWWGRYSLGIINGYAVYGNSFELAGETTYIMVTQSMEIAARLKSRIYIDDRMPMEYVVEGWEKYGYPKYVGGAYQNDSKWIVYMKENTLANQEDVLSETHPYNTPLFVDCSFSHIQLEEAEESLRRDYDVGTGASIRSVSIECCQWPDGVTEPRLLVVLEKLKDYNAFLEEFARFYGKKVVLAVADEEYGYRFPGKAPGKIKASISKDKKKLRIRWEEVERAGKYQLQIFKGKKKVKSISTKKTSYKYSLKKKKKAKYYVRVRVFDESIQRWDVWSGKVRAK